MSIKILLIEANGNWLKKENGEEQVILPIGLMSLASFAKQQFKNKIKIKIYDFTVDCQNDYSKIKTLIKKERPDIVGIRSIITYKKEFEEIAKIAKKNSQALIIGGGPYVSTDINFGLNDSTINMAVIGEGEITFNEIIAKYLKRLPLNNIAGTAVKTEGKIIKNIDRMPINDLDALPIPDYDLINLDKYANCLSYGYNKRKQGVIASSRGCPYSCVYCHKLFGKRFRERSAKSIFEEINLLYKRKIYDFYFIDDVFNLDKKRVIEFCHMISSSKIKGKIRLYFVNGLRGDLIDHETIDALVDAGTIWLAYAIETASPRLQKIICKNLDLEKVKDAIEYSAKKGVIVVYWGLFGHPQETIEEARHTLRFMNKLPPSIIPMLFSMKAYPGTKLYEELKNKPKNFETKYHQFFDLIHQNSKYLQIIKEWEKIINSKEKLIYTVKILIKNGYSPEEIKSTYSILYHTLSKEKLNKIIEKAEAK